MLSVQNVTKQYGDVVALDDISFSVKKGEITGFLGPNGAGKTTTLRIITGFLEPDAGSIRYNKKRLLSNSKEVLSKIGYLPENNPLYTNMRVDEYLRFSADIKDAQQKSDLHEIVEKCGLGDKLTKEIEQLSKGYKQRVGLAKALIGDPEFIFLDEPTEGLDPNQKEEILKLIKSFAKNKVILFSSHVLSEVTQIADKVIIINKGKIAAKGSADELIRKHFKNSVIKIKTNAPYHKLKTALEKTSAISGVEKVTKGRSKFKDYEVYTQEIEKTPVEIFDVMVKNKWKLSEMYAKSQGLEELFKEITK